MDSYLKKMGVDPGSRRELAPESIVDRLGRHVYEGKINVSPITQSYGKTRPEIALYIQIVDDYLDHAANTHHICSQSCASIPQEQRDYALRHGRVGITCPGCSYEWGCIDFLRAFALDIKTRKVDTHCFSAKYRISHLELADAIETVLTDCERALGIESKCQCLLSCSTIQVNVRGSA